MKNIRLKPLYIPNDDILVQPPNFLFSPETIFKEPGSKIYLNNLEELKTILRGRRLKSVQARQKNLKETDQESVLKLSEFKPPQSIARSPLSKRYTFRRSISNLSNEQRSVKASPVKVEETPKFILTLQSIVSREKGKAKEMDSDLTKFTDSNKEYEKSLNNRMKQLSTELESVNELLLSYKAKIKAAQGNRQQEIKSFDDQMSEIMMKEASHTLLLHSSKGKKKHNLDVSEEREYFLVKETLRKAKRDLHQTHIELMEKSTGQLQNMQLMLEQKQAYKRACLKELKDLQEMLINFYCTNLREGMDLRDDGIRWTIKSLWNMNQSVPVSAFPKFLDDDSSHFLLMLSEKELETTYLLNKLTEMREEIKKDRMNASFCKSPNELFTIVKGRLHDIKQKSRALSASCEFMLQTTSEFSTARYDEIKGTKSKLKETEKFIAKATLEEVKRVIAGYAPESFKNVGILHVIRTLVGEKFKDFRRFARLKTSKID